MIHKIYDNDIDNIDDNLFRKIEDKYLDYGILDAINNDVLEIVYIDVFKHVYYGLFKICRK